jgi:hypothetical protein
MPNIKDNPKDPHLSETTIREKYWHAPGIRMLLDDSASRTIINAAEVASTDAVNSSDQAEAKAAVGRLVHDFPEAARKAVERLRAPDNNPLAHRGSIAIIIEDMQQNATPAAGSTPKIESGSRQTPRR